MHHGWTMKNLIFCLLVASAMVVPAHALDEASRTLTACGKPAKDLVIANSNGSGKTHILVYKGVSLHFSEQSAGGAFLIADRKGHFLSQAELTEQLPCFQQVGAAHQSVSLADRAGKSSTGNSGGSGMAGVVLILLIAMGAGAYLFPAFIAGFREVRNIGGIIALNVLLGWTVLGWVGALVWAISGETRQQAADKEIDYERLAAIIQRDGVPPPSPYKLKY